MRFEKIVHDKGKAPGAAFKHALEHFSIEELADAMVVIGYYRLLSIYIGAFQAEIDPSKDGNWVKG